MQCKYLNYKMKTFKFKIFSINISFYYVEEEFCLACRHVAYIYGIIVLSILKMGCLLLCGTRLRR